MLTNRYPRIALPLFFLLDAIGISACYIYVSFLYNLISSLSPWVIFILFFCWLFSSVYFRSYNVIRTLSKKDSVLPTFRALGLFFLLYLALSTLGFLPITSLWFYVSFILLSIVFITIIAYLRIKYVFSYRLSGKNTRYCILISSSPMDNKERQYLTEHASDLGYIFYDFMTGFSSELINQFYRTISTRKTDVVFVIDEGGKQSEIDQLSLLCDEAGIRMKLIMPFAGSAVNRTGLSSIGGYPVVNVRPEPLSYLRNRAVKRIIDIFMSLLSIVFVMLWLPVLVKIAQWISYPGPLFFSQDRVGQDGKIFKLYKFRTMVNNIENQAAEKGVAAKTTVHDSRVPWFGQLLRRTNLDEYPQFINVLLGSMSTVGPRPHMVGEDIHLSNHVHQYRVRRFIKPGITGWAAIRGYRGGTDDLSLMQKRTEHDIWYLENWSLWLDIKIMAITVWQMLTFRIPRAY